MDDDTAARLSLSDDFWHAAQSASQEMRARLQPFLDVRTSHAERYARRRSPSSLPGLPPHEQGFRPTNDEGATASSS
jgi:hypothetical protein